MGTAVRMGPSYFPTVLGWLLAVLGVVIVVSALRPSSPEGSVKAWAFRPLLLVLAGVLAFAFLVQPAGLILAVVALVFMSALGGTEFKFIEVAILSVILVALAVGVFVYGISLPFKLFPF